MVNWWLSSGIYSQTSSASVCQEAHWSQAGWTVSSSSPLGHHIASSKKKNSEYDQNPLGLLITGTYRCTKSEFLLSSNTMFWNFSLEKNNSNWGYTLTRVWRIKLIWDAASRIKAWNLALSWVSWINKGNLSSFSESGFHSENWACNYFPH